MQAKIELANDIAKAGHLPCVVSNLLCQSYIQDFGCLDIILTCTVMKNYNSNIFTQLERENELIIHLDETILDNYVNELPYFGTQEGLSTSQSGARIRKNSSPRKVEILK